MTNTQTYRAGEIIFNEGDPSDVAFVILHGKVEIFNMLPDGTEKSVTILNEGKFFGEYGVMDSAPRSASARAKTDVLLEKKDLKENW
ncbi:MAG: cyclic nucleotide-binding domain-containing protein [Rickettsiales bacterium]